MSIYIGFFFKKKNWATFDQGSSLMIWNCGFSRYCKTSTESIDRNPITCQRAFVLSLDLPFGRLNSNPKSCNEAILEMLLYYFFPLCTFCVQCDHESWLFVFILCTNIRHLTKTLTLWTRILTFNLLDL